MQWLGGSCAVAERNLMTGVPRRLYSARGVQELSNRCLVPARVGNFLFATVVFILDVGPRSLLSNRYWHPYTGQSSQSMKQLLVRRLIKRLLAPRFCSPSWWCFGTNVAATS